MYCVTKASAPPSWRRSTDCDQCIDTEYCAEFAPEDTWVWDAALGLHRAPTAAERKAIAIVAKKAEVKAWLTAINGRAYQHAGNSDDFDDMLADLRTAVRNLVNNVLAEITPAVAARVSAVEAKAAFTAAAGTFDLIQKAKEARTAMNAELAALATEALVLAYEVGDTKAGTAHATAYPTASPTLAALLVQYPTRTE